MKTPRSGAGPAPYASSAFPSGFGEAVVAAAECLLAVQVNFFRVYAERVAGDPRASMMAVEGAHQMYDLAVTIADTSQEFCRAGLAVMYDFNRWPSMRE